MSMKSWSPRDYPKEDPTWEDALQFAKAAGLENDEYFSFQRYDESPIDITSEIWKGTRWVACYWVMGGSEGWYLHIDRIDREGTRQGMFLGKYWAPARAAFAADLMTRWFYQLFKREGELIQEGLKHYEDYHKS